MIFEKLAVIVAEQFGVEADSITKDTTFEGDLGADSLDIVELSMALEENFDLGELEDSEAAKLHTVGDLVRLVQSRVED